MFGTKKISLLFVGCYFSGHEILNLKPKTKRGKTKREPGADPEFGQDGPQPLRPKVADIAE